MAKGVSELHGLSFCVWHPWGQKSHMFSFVSDFVTKIQNPRFKEFTILSLDNFLDGERDEMLLCPISALSKHLPGWSSTVLGFPICSSHCVRGRNGCPETPFCFGLDRSSALHKGLLPLSTADWLGFRHTSQKDCDFIAVQEGLCNPASIEGWVLVVLEYLLSLLPLRCYP